MENAYLSHSVTTDCPLKLLRFSSPRRRNISNCPSLDLGQRAFRNLPASSTRFSEHFPVPEHCFGTFLLFNFQLHSEAFESVILGHTKSARSALHARIRSHDANSLVSRPLATRCDIISSYLSYPSANCFPIEFSSSMPLGEYRLTHSVVGFMQNVWYDPFYLLFSPNLELSNIYKAAKEYKTRDLLSPVFLPS